MTSYKYYFKNYNKKYYNIYTRKQKVVNNFKFINYFILFKMIKQKYVKQKITTMMMKNLMIYYICYYKDSINNNLNQMNNL